MKEKIKIKKNFIQIPLLALITNTQLKNKRSKKMININ